MANFVKKDYGQVEPNHLSAQRTAQIYAQLPAADYIEVLENGQFAKYDYVNNVVDFENVVQGAPFGNVPLHIHFPHTSV